MASGKQERLAYNVFVYLSDIRNEVSGVNESPVISHATPVQQVFVAFKLAWEVWSVYLLEIHLQFGAAGGDTSRNTLAVG